MNKKNIIFATTALAIVSALIYFKVKGENKMSEEKAVNNAKSTSKHCDQTCAYCKNVNADKTAMPCRECTCNVHYKNHFVMHPVMEAYFKNEGGFSVK